MEYIRTLTREFQVGERADLQIDNRSGTVAVRGEDTQVVHIEVIARLWAEDDAEADDQAELIARGIQQDGERVAVRAPALLRPGAWLVIFGRGPRVDYQLTVPRATRARIASRSGRVEAMNLAGPAEIETRSGKVTVGNIGADTTITSRSGRIEAEAVAGSLTAEARSGRVQARRCDGDVKVRTRSGSLHVEDVGGDLRIESRSGALTISSVGGALSARTASGAVRYEGALNGPFDIDVLSGYVVLAVDPDSNFFLDAETTSGSVDSELPLRPAASGSTRRPAGPTVRVRTRSGAIRIVPR